MNWRLERKPGDRAFASAMIELLDKRGVLPLKLTESIVTNSYKEFKRRALAASSKADAFFVLNHDTLRDESGNEVHFSFDREPGGRMLDIPGIVAGLPAQAHVYCCGPLPMLDAFEAATKALVGFKGGVVTQVTFLVNEFTG